jgi:hypothetical protein
MVYRCRAQKDDGTLCRNRVRDPDVRCYLHPGKPAGHVPSPRKRPAKRPPIPRQAPRRVPTAGNRPRRRPQPPQAPRTPTRADRERQRAVKAARVCADVVERGGAVVIAERASAYVPDETWQTLVKRHRKRGCDDLAALARNILPGEELLHAAVGRTASGILGLLGRPRIERVFAQELAQRIPLPVDMQLSAAARGLQIAGIYICVVGGRDLVECACLRDVLGEEGKERLQQLIQGAMDDWQLLPQRMLG